MERFDECSVLIPSATLEDFPTNGTTDDARSLLAAWTVLWHPVLLARTEQMPTWYRADSPPSPDGPRVVTVPRSSIDQVPTEFRRKCEANPHCRWIEGKDRHEMLAALDLSIDDSGLPAEADLAPLSCESRPLALDDFFAAGYLVLQTQIMTRRLRYTSNLDELHLQSRIVAAAKAFLERQSAECAEALHDVFDCLSEERDHYFSSDPHLLELTLLTPRVLSQAIKDGWIDRLGQRGQGGDESNGVLATPSNLLISADVCRAASQQPELQSSLRTLVSLPAIGWAGGGLDESDQAGEPDRRTVRPTNCLDLQTHREAVDRLHQSFREASDVMGEAPRVFGQLSGLFPADLMSNLAEIGYRGVVPIDFVHGTGFGDESKVLLGSDGNELEALVARPIDAADDTFFLALGAELGEAIDGGEVATGLFVHWPDHVCDSFRDLRRAATWCVAMGRFWTLERYFVDGEKPYHTGSLESVGRHAADAVIDALSETTTLGELAKSFRKAVEAETDQVTLGIASLADPRRLDQADDSIDQTLAHAIGVKTLDPADPNQSVIFNPHAVAIRRSTQLFDGGPNANESFVFASSRTRNQGEKPSCQITFDVPALGIGRVGATER
ncbi:MAG: hypothetical protein AAGJ83_13580, partial [Planctomycetota bacterium]